MSKLMPSRRNKNQPNHMYRMPSQELTNKWRNTNTKLPKKMPRHHFKLVPPPSNPMNTNTTTAIHLSSKPTTSHSSSYLTMPHPFTTTNESRTSLPSTIQSTARLTTPLISANLLRCKIFSNSNHYRNAIIIENIKEPLSLKSTILFEELPHTAITLDKISGIKGEYILLRAHQQNDTEIILITKQIHLQATTFQKLKFLLYRYISWNPIIFKYKSVTEKYIIGYGYIIKPDSSTTSTTQ